jgi:mannose-6-phosphate isomerase-like protein (cupin superfamily)
MYHACDSYPCYGNTPMYNPIYSQVYGNQMVPQMMQQMMQQQLPYQYDPYNGTANSNGYMELKDYGPDPFTVNIEEATTQNDNFRTALWTGKHLQLTLMSIGVGEDIGLEIHPEHDQFIRIEQGQGLVKMGDSRDRLDYQRMVNKEYAFIIPAGKWHNLINTGNVPIKLYSIYAPPKHPHGTVHKTKADAQAAEH